MAALVNPDDWNTAPYFTTPCWNFNALSTSFSCFTNGSASGSDYSTTNSPYPYFDSGRSFVMQSVIVAGLPVGGTSTCAANFAEDEGNNWEGDLINNRGDCTAITCVTLLQYWAGSFCSYYQPTLLASPDSPEACVFTFVRYQYPGCSVPTVLLYATQSNQGNHCSFVSEGFVYFSTGQIACGVANTVPFQPCVAGANDAVSTVQVMRLGTLEDVTSLGVQFGLVTSISSNPASVMLIYRDTSTNKAPRVFSIIPTDINGNNGTFYNNVYYQSGRWADIAAGTYTLFEGTPYSLDGWANASYAGLYTDANYSFTNGSFSSSLVGSNVYNPSNMLLNVQPSVTNAVYGSIMWNLVLTNSSAPNFPFPSSVAISGARYIFNQSPDDLALAWTAPTSAASSQSFGSYIASCTNGGISVGVSGNSTFVLNHKLTAGDTSITITTAQVSTNGDVFNFCQSRYLDPSLMPTTFTIAQSVMNGTFLDPSSTSFVSKTLYYSNIPSSLNRAYGVIYDTSSQPPCYLGVQVLSVQLLNSTNNTLTFVTGSVAGATVAVPNTGSISVPLQNNSINYYIADDTSTQYKMAWTLTQPKTASDPPTVALDVSGCPFMGSTSVSGFVWGASASAFQVACNFTLHFNAGKSYNFDQKLMQLLIGTEDLKLTPIITGSTILDASNKILCSPGIEYSVPLDGLTGATIMTGTELLHKVTIFG